MVWRQGRECRAGCPVGEPEILKLGSSVTGGGVPLASSPDWREAHGRVSPEMGAPWIGDVEAAWTRRRSASDSTGGPMPATSRSPATQAAAALLVTRGEAVLRRIGPCCLRPDRHLVTRPTASAASSPLGRAVWAPLRSAGHSGRTPGSACRHCWPRWSPFTGSGALSLGARTSPKPCPGDRATAWGGDDREGCTARPGRRSAIG